jgi:hypothetical protein
MTSESKMEDGGRKRKRGPERKKKRTDGRMLIQNFEIQHARKFIQTRIKHTHLSEITCIMIENNNINFPDVTFGPFNAFMCTFFYNK